MAKNCENPADPHVGGGEMGKSRGGEMGKSRGGGKGGKGGGKMAADDMTESTPVQKRSAGKVAGKKKGRY